MKKRIVYICVIACAIALAGNVVFAQKSDSPKADYRLQSTDVLTITVHGQPDLTTKTRISSDGFISFPLIGKVEVKNLTVQELEERLKGLLEKDYLVTAEVLVFIEEYHERQVSIIGEVKSPGKYEMPSEKDMTLMQAIAVAGGFTKNADITNVKLMRLEDNVQKTMTTNIRDITIRGEKDKDIRILPGDVVSVPEGFFHVSVIGEVNKAGKYELSQEKRMTLLEAVAMAGGFTKDADVRSVKVMRFENGEQKTIVVNVRDITVKGDKDKDIVIEPGDVVSVPEGFFRVSVIGEVNKPGKCDMSGEKNVTLLEAVAMAGGFTKHADITKTRIMRMENGEKRTIIVNVKDITEKGEKEKDVELEPDDIVFVPESFF